RRLGLVAEAARRDLLVVEDDYDSEFRYDVAPLPSLAGLDRQRVVHLRTTSKAVSPGLRLGWLVAPADLVTEMAERRAASHDVPSWPVQRAWWSMMREGYADKLVRAARRVYRARGDRVSRALAGHGRLGGPVAGMYLTIHLPPEVVAAVREDAARAGFDVPSLAETSRSSAGSGLVVGFGGVTDDELDRALDVLTAALERRS
ncbi:MAG: PLP-dependent aminotransferase family protein, partial [Nocardioides sp.]|nr:PLP-dependent aminotransferase family protein [Nocardioides sp.]